MSFIISAEFCFEHLDAPVLRLGSMDTPVPFAGNLENGFLASTYLDEVMERLLGY
jgi:2-oxoisovalerate dehydrogenase E1 component